MVGYTDLTVNTVAAVAGVEEEVLQVENLAAPEHTAEVSVAEVGSPGAVRTAAAHMAVAAAAQEDIESCQLPGIHSPSPPALQNNRWLPQPYQCLAAAGH